MFLNKKQWACFTFGEYSVYFMIEFECHVIACKTTKLKMYYNKKWTDIFKSDIPIILLMHFHTFLLELIISILGINQISFSLVIKIYYMLIIKLKSDTKHEIRK